MSRLHHYVNQYYILKYHSCFRLLHRKRDNVSQSQIMNWLHCSSLCKSNRKKFICISRFRTDPPNIHHTFWHFLELSSLSALVVQICKAETTDSSHSYRDNGFAPLYLVRHFSYSGFFPLDKILSDDVCLKYSSVKIAYTNHRL